LKDEPVPSGEIDLARVIRQVKVRRLPRVLAVGAAGCLAIAAIAVPVSVAGLGNSSGGSIVAEDGGAPESATEAEGDATMVALTLAETLNSCGAPLAEVAPAASGLVATVAPVDAAASSLSIETTVTLTNTGTTAVRGTTGAPVLTLSQDGVTLWHFNAPRAVEVIPIDLAPGESLEYPASFTPRVCGAAADAGEGTSLPLPDAGEYGLSAAIDLIPAGGASAELVTGPVAPVVLR
jgi:hypothetical protein